MKRKVKFSIEFKEDLVKEYLQGRCSLVHLCSKYDISLSYFKRLVLMYEKQGSLSQQDKNNSYEKSFKLECVLSVQKRGLSLSQAARIFGVPSDGTISKWIGLYNEFGEEGFSKKPRGRRKAMSDSKKKKTKVSSSDPKLSALEEELEYLRAENAYLKKLNALIQEEELKAIQSKSKSSKN